MAEAKREDRPHHHRGGGGHTSQVPKVTVGAFLMEWLDSRRVRPNTLDGYRAALKPVIDHLGTVPLQHLDTPHLDELVTLRLTGEPILIRHLGDSGGGHSACAVLLSRNRRRLV